MIITDCIREVSVWTIEFEDHIIAINADIHHRTEHALGSGGRVFATVMVHGSHDVFGCERLAIVEFDTLTNRKDPCLSVIRGEAFGKLGNEFTGPTLRSDDWRANNNIQQCRFKVPGSMGSVVDP